MYLASRLTSTVPVVPRRKTPSECINLKYPSVMYVCIQPARVCTDFVNVFEQDAKMPSCLASGRAVRSTKAQSLVAQSCWPENYQRNCLLVCVKLTTRKTEYVRFKEYSGDSPPHEKRIIDRLHLISPLESTTSTSYNLEVRKHFMICPSCSTSQEVRGR